MHNPQISEEKPRGTTSQKSLKVLAEAFGADTAHTVQRLMDSEKKQNAIQSPTL